MLKSLQFLGVSYLLIIYSFIAKSIGDMANNVFDTEPLNISIEKHLNHLLRL